ncbi:MAG: hypothetical protein ACLPSW_27530, partial [Roseiarcus sp.]
MTDFADRRNGLPSEPGARARLPSPASSHCVAAIIRTHQARKGFFALLAVADRPSRRRSSLRRILRTSAKTIESVFGFARCGDLTRSGGIPSFARGRYACGD